MYVEFDNAPWSVDGIADQGVYPVTAITKYWHVDPKGQTLKVKRTQQPVAPDYARTAYSSQGMTLAAAIVDLCFDENMDPATAYVSLSRVKTADDILIMQAFGIQAFTQGSPLGPRMLLKKLRGEDIQPDIDAHLSEEAQQREEERTQKALDLQCKAKLIRERKAAGKRQHPEEDKERHSVSYKANKSHQIQKQREKRAADKEAERLVADSVPEEQKERRSQEQQERSSEEEKLEQERHSVSYKANKPHQIQKKGQKRASDKEAERLVADSVPEEQKERRSQEQKKRCSEEEKQRLATKYEANKEEQIRKKREKRLQDKKRRAR
jgi:hypothetical protein